MVAYNFHPRFAAPIRAGTKCQTIRKISGKRHAQAGERAQLYVGQRTKACWKILEPDPIVTSVRPISMVFCEDDIILPSPDGALPDKVLDDAFAQADGFHDLEDMRNFWLTTHGLGRFDGVVIRWGAA